MENAAAWLRTHWDCVLKCSRASKGQIVNSTERASQGVFHCVDALFVSVQIHIHVRMYACIDSTDDYLIAEAAAIANKYNNKELEYIKQQQHATRMRTTAITHSNNKFPKN